MKKILFACLLLAATASLGAQNPQPLEGKPAHHPKRITPETIAQSKTDKMRETLSLTEKQCKKLYKLNLQEAQEQQAKHSPRPGSKRPQGLPPRGERPEREGFRPGMPPREDINNLSPEQRKKNAEKREKKLKKILGEEKFAQWKNFAAEEQKNHPNRPETKGMEIPPIPAQKTDGNK